MIHENNRKAIVKYADPIKVLQEKNIETYFKIQKI